MQMYKESNHHIRPSNNPPKIFPLKEKIENHQKLLTNTQTVSLHRHHPKITQHHLQLPKTPKDLHEFPFKITHIPLKNDTLVYLNH